MDLIDPGPHGRQALGVIQQPPRGGGLPRVPSQVPTDSFSSSVCSFGQRCLKTRSGKTVCVHDGKQSYPEESSQHKVDKLETFANSPLQEACRKGELHRVRQILSRGLTYVNIRDERHGMTALMVAAQEGHCKLFDFLIRNGANMSEVDNDCKNALHWACKGGHVCVRECVLRHYSINTNARNMRPLVQAATRGYIDVVEFLVCTGSNVSQINDDGSNILHLACKGGHLAVVKYLLSENSVDINRKGKKGRTPLMVAVVYRRRVVFEFLLRNGAKVSQVDDNGDNVLHYACFSGHYDLVKPLLSQSVDINRKGKKGMTPLMVAVIHGHRDVFEFLMQNGANVSQVDDNGHNVLFFALRGGVLDVVKYLLFQSSVDINRKLKNGRTPLMVAVVYGSRDIFMFLMRKGADVSPVDDYGDNILHMACRRRQLDVVKYLVLKSTVDINSRKKDGQTSLMEAALRGKIDVFDSLMNMGANASHVDDNADNILHLAASGGRVKMVKHILSQNLVDIHAKDKDGNTAAMIAKLERQHEVHNLLVS